VSDLTTGIGFKNFRRFENFPLLEFGPITYMVGRNNAGKTTIVKGLLLVMDYLQNQLSDRFSFDDNVLEEANIVTFGRAKNSFLNEPIIEFSIQIESYQIKVEVSGIDESTSANVTKFKLDDQHSGYFLEVDYITKRIKIHKTLQYVQKKSDKDSEELRLDTEIKKLKEEQALYKTKASKEALKIADQINSIDKRKKDLYEDSEDQEDLFEFNLNYSINFEDFFEEQKEEDNDIEEDEDGYGVYGDAYNMDEFPDHIPEFHEKVIDKDNSDDWHSQEYDLKPPKTEENQLKEMISLFLYQNTVNYKQYLDKRDKVIKSSGLSEKYSDVIELHNQGKELKNWIDKVVASIDQQFFIYLGSNPTKQSALFSLRDKKNPLAKAIHEFYQTGVEPGDMEWRFVKRWMERFEVGDDFEIKLYAGEAYEFHVKTKNKVNPFSENSNHLADKGMGSLQAMVIILSVATIIRKHLKKRHKNITIILEEPEQNLHPALHSMLTEFFHEIYTQYGIKFLIETHSEYIIRKSQLIGLTEDYFSNQKLNPNPFKVYYFHKDEGPYEMEYTPQGKFEKDFGKGFYDEASKMAMEQIKLIRKSN